MRFFCERTPWYGFGVAYVPKYAEAHDQMHGDLHLFVLCWCIGVEWRTNGQVA